VRALARNPNKPDAQALRNQGVEMVQGDLDNPSSVMEAMKDVYGVFSVQAVLSDPEKEVRQGKRWPIPRKQRVYLTLFIVSAIGADRNIGIPVSKRVEDRTAHSFFESVSHNT